MSFLMGILAVVVGGVLGNYVVGPNVMVVVQEGFVMSVLNGMRDR
jgi:hypothetical protein